MITADVLRNLVSSIKEVRDFFAEIRVTEIFLVESPIDEEKDVIHFIIPQIGVACGTDLMAIEALIASKIGCESEDVIIVTERQIPVSDRTRVCGTKVSYSLENQDAIIKFFDKNFSSLFTRSCDGTSSPFFASTLAFPSKRPLEDRAERPEEERSTKVRMLMDTIERNPEVMEALRTVARDPTLLEEILLKKGNSPPTVRG